MVNAKKGKPGPTFAFEAECRRAGFNSIAGIDEAGRGALAGPVVAAAVVLPVDLPAEARSVIDDSKKLTVNQRNVAFDIVRRVAVSHGVGIVDAGRIDAIGIVLATKMAMREAIRANGIRIDFLLIDAVKRIGIATPSKSIIRGDSQSLSIAAASIIAKVTRDRIMSEEMEPRHPGYGLAKHKGYGTAFHLNALNELGPCPIHRRTFNPVAQLIADASWNALGATSSVNIAASGSLRLSDGMGSNGEAAAVQHLQRLGYRIVDRNFRTRHGEVDIIAEHEGALVFVEVKARSSSRFGSPAEGVTSGKLRRIQNAAEAYIATKVGRQDVDWRIDFVGVQRRLDGRSLEIEVIRNAHL